MASHATSADGSQSVATGQGDISSVIVGSGATVGDIQIYQSDAAQVRQQKLERAQGLLAAEVTANLRALDHRLALVDAATRPDDFDAGLSAVRRQMASATEPQFAKGYQQLISSSQVASLRHTLNSGRLRPDLPGPLLQVLLDAGAPGEPAYARTAQVFTTQLNALGAAGGVDGGIPLCAPRFTRTRSMLGSSSCWRTRRASSTLGQAGDAEQTLERALVGSCAVRGGRPPAEGESRSDKGRNDRRCHHHRVRQRRR